MTAPKKDRRLYGKFTLDFPRNAKIAILSDAAFRCLVEATLYSRDQLTDGLLARRYAIATWGLETLKELCQNDAEKPSLIETEQGWLIRDYAEHQDTKAEVEARSIRNAAAGQRGGLAKSNRTAKQHAKRPASDSLSEVVSESVAVVETVEEITEPAKAGSSRATQRRQPTFTEQLRGTPDPIPDAPPEDLAVRAVSKTTAADLVRAVLPPNVYPNPVLTDIRIRVGVMLTEGVDPELIQEALRLWDARSEGGPGLFPHLLADAAKSLRPKQPAATAYERKTAHNAAIFAQLANTTEDLPAKELTR